MSAPTLAGVRHHARNVTVAGGSLAALVAVVLFLIAPNSSALVLSAKAGGSAATGSEVLYGKFTDAAGHPVTGAKLKVSHVVRKIVVRHHRKRHVNRNVVVARATSNARGLYRIPAHLPSGTYTVAVSEKVGNKVYSASKQIAFKAGKAYEISGTIENHTLFSFLPISTY